MYNALNHIILLILIVELFICKEEFVLAILGVDGIRSTGEPAYLSKIYQAFSMDQQHARASGSIV